MSYFYPVPFYFSYISSFCFVLLLLLNKRVVIITTILKIQLHFLFFFVVPFFIPFMNFSHNRNNCYYAVSCFLTFPVAITTECVSYISRCSYSLYNFLSLYIFVSIFLYSFNKKWHSVSLLLFIYYFFSK